MVRRGAREVWREEQWYSSDSGVGVGVEVEVEVVEAAATQATTRVEIILK